MKNNTTRFMVAAALLAALDIVFVRLLPSYFLPPGQYLFRITPQFLCYGLAGWLIGPGWAMGTAAVADIIGAMVNPTGPGTVFPGYTLTAILSGLVYGLMLYRRKPQLWRGLTAAGLHLVAVALPLTSLWMLMQNETPFLTTFWLALPWRAAAVPLFGIALFGVQKALGKPTARLFGG
ncbi:MAG: folate family ECF transporter S component [Oscillospiraceae bacterium]|jgi:ECF transporter S component (folate family)|nr:folate family ECF transporter S component [Oscillospiraceae bacterium]